MLTKSIKTLSDSLGIGFVRASFVSAALGKETANILGSGSCTLSQVKVRKSVKSLVILLLANY